MPDLLIRDIDPETYERLKKASGLKGQSRGSQIYAFAKTL
jgi:hypothetical protein